jgi:transposase
VREYAVLRVVAQLTKAKIFFVDEAHFYADADLRGKWVLRGEPALVDSTSPRYGEKASYYSAVCVETGEVEFLALEGNSSAETSVAFLRHLRARHTAPLIVIWDNAPAHGGAPIRAYLATPGLTLRLVRLPAYSPDFNPDEHIWGWIRAEVTANTCFGTAAKVRAHVDPFFAGLAARADEVKRRCQTVLQTRADALNAVDAARAILHQARHARHLYADPTLALVYMVQRGYLGTGRAPYGFWNDAWEYVQANNPRDQGDGPTLRAWYGLHRKICPHSYLPARAVNA